MISELKSLGRIEFPKFSGIRVMMLPFRFEDPAGTLPGLSGWREVAARLCDWLGAEGVGYLTVDEAEVLAGDTQRRPGLHVDGCGSWGSGGGGWSKRGMVVASSSDGCRAWRQEFGSAPTTDGDCSGLERELGRPMTMGDGEAFLCSPMMVHEAPPLRHGRARQFIRLSLPNDAPWFEGYTPSPFGILPTGPILPRRSEQLAHRP